MTRTTTLEWNVDMDQQTVDFIDQLIANYMYTGKSFTSLDITNATKQHGYRVRNRAVADYLRSKVIRIAYSNGVLYNQSLIRVDSKAAGWTLAYLYHHMNTDVDSYLDRDQNPQSYQTGTSADNLATASQVARSAMNAPALDDEEEDDSQSTYASTVGLIGQALKRAVQNRRPVVTASQNVGNDNWKTQRRDSKGRWV